MGGDIFGECWWNPNATFYYVSGFVGYLLLAHYIRVHVSWSKKKILSICLPMLALLYVVCFVSADYYSTRATAPAVLEQDWQNLTPLAIGMSSALFMLFTTIKGGADGWLYNKVILPISTASYGMYLMHMLMLPHWFALYNQLLPAWLTIPATAVSTYVCCFGISWAVGKLPLGKYIVG